MFFRFAGCAALAFLLCTPLLSAQSVYPRRVNDGQAVYLEPGKAGAVGDGRADDTAALQHALDTVADTTKQGIVFLAPGRYRVSRTVYIWPGVRLIGYGPERPVITLGARTPGFATDPAYMLFFAGARLLPGADSGPRRRPTTPFRGTVPSTIAVDANPGTFYSAISNVDMEIGEGNPGAIGVRSHYAQHCFLSHMTFRIGSGLAGIDEAGNLADDLHFEGGDYGIRTGKPSPGWQFTLLDSSFSGQRKAAIREHEAGLTLVHSSIRNEPEGISIDPGFAEELWVEDSEFRDVRGPAITVSNEHNARTEINVRNARCVKVPVFARLRESGKEFPAAGNAYRVTSFSHGLTLKDLKDQGAIETSFHADPSPSGSGADFARNAVLQEPSPAEPWANLRDLGAVGDGVHDDTAAVQAAVRDHRIVYAPSGRYRLTATVQLRPDTVLFGLHPSTTEFVLDDESPNFNGAGGPVPMLVAPPSGTTSVSGIGLYAGGINNRATALLWQAGEHSQVNDVRFLGGHGTNKADGTRANPYNPTHSGDPDPRKRWDAQYPSLWVLHGGGTFANIWTPDTYAQAGMMISDTETPGRVYELSSEHHVRNEVELRHAAHWEILALQTEEEWGESGHALPLSIQDSHDILVANFHSYRVVGSRDTLPEAVQVRHSEDIRFRNAHIDSDSKVAADNGIADAGSGAAERFHEFSNLDVTTVGSGGLEAAAASPGVQRLAGGFNNISGAAVDASGRVLFADPRTQRIYRWSPATGSLELLRDAPLSATNLAVDRSGNVLVVCYDGDGTVYSFNPDGPPDALRKLDPQPAAAAQTGAVFWLPNDRWNFGQPRVLPENAARPFQYVSPDGSAVIPAGADFVHGELYYGTKMSDVLRSFALAPAAAGKRIYLTEEEENRTWQATVGPTGALTNLQLFAEQGGEAVTTDKEGHVYVAAGQVFEYSADGKLLREIAVPERPVNLLFGGPNGETLFILARTSLYAWRPGALTAQR